MPQPQRPGLAPFFLIAALLPACAAPAARPETPASPERPRSKDPDPGLVDVERIEERSPAFIANGEPFCFAGANNYYLHYKSRDAVRDVLDSAVEMRLGVLRIWAFLDRGSLDGKVPNVHGDGSQDGVYYQAWDSELKKPLYNDGPDGLERLDFVVREARVRGLKLILVLTNNWRDFGGMDQYLAYFGLNQHHAFYTDERVKSAYKDWVTHLALRTNSIDGVAYKDDPAVFSWELANEPRTINRTDFDAPEGWDAKTITTWADEMSAHLRRVDPNHMISVGDEGFLSSGGQAWMYEAPFGVDSEALTSLPNIDFGTFHLYPDHFGITADAGNDWITKHLELGRRLDKPYVLEEYGLRVERRDGDVGPIVRGLRSRSIAYANWNNLVLHQGGAGALLWNLSGYEEPGQLYPDFDRFTIYRGEESANMLASFARRMPREAAACEGIPQTDVGALSPFVRPHRVRTTPVPD